MFYQLTPFLLHLFKPEVAHHLAIRLLRLFPVSDVTASLDLTRLSQEIAGLKFPHPLGLAAGFDKDAEVFDKLGQLGFSFVEIGSVTPQAQPGNPKPRLFRVPDQQAIINRYGFNSKGLAYAAEQLQRYPHTCITGINLGKNKTSTNDVDDFLTGAATLVQQADYFTINVSSPNTPGLRDLQKPTALAPIVNGIQAIIRQSQRRIPLLVKLSPDMELAQESALIEFLAQENVDGLIISNTTLSRAGVSGQHAAEQGGLSGPPLRDLATAMIRRVHTLTEGKLLIVGCGGVGSGVDAYEKLQAGARLLQIYTAFIYQGPLAIRHILTDLNALLVRNGVRNVAEIVGTGGC